VKSKLFKNGIYNTVGGGLKIGIGIFTIPLIIRLLGTSEYGLWSLTFSVVSVVLLSEAGLSMATTIFAVEDLKKRDVNGLCYTLTATLGAILILATTASIGMLTFSDSIVNSFGDMDANDKVRAVLALRISSLIVWTKLVQQVFVGIEQAYERYDIINTIGIITSISTGLTMIFIALCHGRVAELMIGQAVNSIFSLIANLSAVIFLFKSENFIFKIKFSLKRSLEIAKYSFTMWLTTLGGVLFSKVDRLIVGKLLGIQILGIYSAITDITIQINVFSALAIQPIVSTVTGYKLSDNSEVIKIRAQVLRSLVINTAIALILGSVLMCGATWILQKGLNISFVETRHIFSFKAAIVIYSLYSVNAVGYFILIGTKKMFMSSSISMLVGLLSLVLIFFGCQIGLTGAIIGNAGFLGVYGFTFLGMRTIGVKTIDWIRSIWLVVLSFTIISLISMYELASPSVTILLFFVFCGYLFKDILSSTNRRNSN
jgi:O-antigen/teichoic acid export membrane protein